jgi:hypothetical protein
LGFMSDVLPRTAPDLNVFHASGGLIISGFDSSRGYTVFAKITSLRLRGPTLYVSPSSGSYFSKQGFDFMYAFDDTLNPIVSTKIQVNGIDVTSSLAPSTIKGKMVRAGKSYGKTFRVEDLQPGNLTNGLNSVTVTLGLQDGSTRDQTVNWNIIGNTEP